MLPYPRSRRIVGILCAILIATLFAALALILPTAPAVHAATTWLVTSTADGAAVPANCPGVGCRLRDALAAALSGDTIDFQLSLPATITLTAGQLGFNTDLTLNGPTTTTLAVSGNNASRVFAIGGKTNINNLTIRDGNEPADSGGAIAISSFTVLTLTNTSVISNSAQSAGGIWNNGGALILISSTVSNNFATNHAGGVYINSSNASLTMTSTTVSGNIASTGSGGGILSGGGVTITNSTISNNQINGVGSAGGGIYNVGRLTIDNSTINGNQITASNGGGGIFASSSITMTLTNVTISGNKSFPAGTGWGGGMLSVNTTATLNHVTIANNQTGSNGGGGIRTTGSAQFSIKNTLISGNSAGYGPDCAPGVSINSEDYNLIQNPSNCPLSGTTANNITGVNPKLTPLGLLGGSTQTHGLISGSPALDQIPNSTNGCGTTFTTDQRGISRPQNGSCDIGTKEQQPHSTRL